MAKVLSVVSERRLRPIYEHLDNGNNKKALHEADKVLKKQKDLSAAKVLKTIALHRMGKVEEAFSLSEEVICGEPTDENSLQGLSLYYKEIGKTELISFIYENAVKHCPKNEEYHTHLFMSYVRHEKFQQMQRVAMSLYKQHSKNPYLFWGIMAIVLQAQHANDEKLAKNMYLPLAEKMIEKHIEKGKIEAEAEVRLYLLILDLAGKHKKALDVLNGPLGKKLTSELNGLKLSILKTKEKEKLWEEVNVEYKQLLKENPDIWNYAIGYLDSFFQLLNQNLEPDNDKEADSENRPLDKPDFTLTHAFEFIMNLVKAENEVMELKKRGPYLLRLEMLKRLQLRNDESQGGSPVKLLLEYALDFSTKPCCFHDLVPYFCLLPPKDIDKFLADLYEQQAIFTYNDMNGECSESLKREINRRKEKEIQRHIFTIEATRFLGKHESLWNEEKLTLATDYLQRHESGLRFSSDRPPTDGHVVDSYCLFAVRLLLDVYLDTEDTALLWRCASVLEYGLAHSEYNYEMKFMLIRVYCRLGLFTPCTDLYDSLEIKHVQHDTLGYTISQHVVSLGHFHVASRFFQMAKSFYLSNNKESVECLISCFRNGTFYKVSELVDYRKTVKNSLHGALTRTEHALMNLYVEGDLDQPVAQMLASNPPEIDYAILTDNRDFSFHTDINPENKRLTQELINENVSEEKAWLLFRELLLRCLRAILAPTTSEPQQQNGHQSEKAASSTLDELITRFEKLCTYPPKKSPVYPFHGPHTSKLHLCHEANYPQTMLLLFKYCRCLYDARNPDGSESKEDNFSPYLTNAISNISDFLKTCCDGILVEPKSDDYSNEGDVGKSKTILSEPIPDVLLCIRPCVIERLVLCTEMLSLTILLVTNMQSIITETKAEIQRRRRRKKGKQPNDAMPAWIKGYQESISKVKSLGTRLTAAVNQLKLDADTMLLDLAKSRLINKNKAKSSAAEEDVSEEQPESRLLESEQKLGTGDSSPSTKENNIATNRVSENVPESTEARPDPCENELKPNTVPPENKTIAKEPSDKDTSASKTSDLKENQENSIVDETIQSLKEVKLNEESTSTKSTPTESPASDSASAAKFEMIIKGATESVTTSCKQLQAVIDGRMKHVNVDESNVHPLHRYFCELAVK